MVARMFGKWPWELDEAPEDGYLEMMEALSLEGELSRKYPPKGA